MEKYFPMDIFPMQLIKACMRGDIEKMESLGIYEVVPEDFGLVDFSCTSKIEAQEIVKSGIEINVKRSRLMDFIRKQVDVLKKTFHKGR